MECSLSACQSCLSNWTVEEPWLIPAGSWRSGSPSSHPGHSRNQLAARRNGSCPDELLNTVILQSSELWLQHSPGSLVSCTSVAVPPSMPATYLAASFSSGVPPFPTHSIRALGVFSTNTSLVFKDEALGSTWISRTRSVTSGSDGVNRLWWSVS